MKTLQSIRKICTSTLLLLFFSKVGNLYAQNEDTLIHKNSYVISGFFETGRVQSSNIFLKQINATNEELGEFSALSFRLLKQTTGKNLWEQYYHYPSYGFGIYAARFFNNQYLSTPISIYGAYENPIKRWDKWSLNSNFGFGLTLNWEGFNPSENNFNISLGANISSYINAGLSLNYELSPHFDLGLGYNLTHFSNGGMKIPNYGLNTMVPKISLDYRFNRFEPPKQKTIIPPYVKNTTLDFSFYGGEKNVIYPERNIDTATHIQDVYYPVFGFNAILYRQLSYKSKLGLGLTLGYDGSKNADIQVKNGIPVANQRLNGTNMTISIYPSYEQVLDRLALFVQPSFYILKKQTSYARPSYFTRVGFTYTIHKQFFSGLSLHSYHFHKADFIEWTVGYKLQLTKNNDRSE